MQHRILVTLTILFFLQGCGGESSMPTEVAPPNDDTQTESQSASEVELLNNIASLLEGSACDAGSELECKLVEVSYEPAPDWSNENRPRRRILLIDKGFASATMTGYRNRILELYTTSESMSLLPYRPSLNMPESLDKVFEAIKNYDSFISVEKFKQFQTDKILNLIRQISFEIGHGYFIGGFLLEHNPEAQFVVLEKGEESWLYSPAAVCDQLLDANEQVQAQALSLIQQRFDQYFQSIQEIVNHHQIDYINASWGASRSAVSQVINRSCGAMPVQSLVSEILLIDHQFMQQLAEISYVELDAIEQQVVLVQAGAAGNSGVLYEGHPDFPADCDSSMTNRIRVSGFMYAGTDIPVDGASDHSALSHSNRQRWDCIDTYLPLGQYYEGVTSKIRDRSMRQIYHGFWQSDVFPTYTSPSMAAPVVLSGLNYHQSQSTVKLSPAELFEVFTQGNKIADPLQHQLFNVYQLGYRKR